MAKRTLSTSYGRRTRRRKAGPYRRLRLHSRRRPRRNYRRGRRTRRRRSMNIGLKLAKKMYLFNQARATKHQKFALRSIGTKFQMRKHRTVATSVSSGRNYPVMRLNIPYLPTNYFFSFNPVHQSVNPWSSAANWGVDAYTAEYPEGASKVLIDRVKYKFVLTQVREGCTVRMCIVSYKNKTVPFHAGNKRSLEGWSTDVHEPPNTDDYVIHFTKFWKFTKTEINAFDPANPSTIFRQEYVNPDRKAILSFTIPHNKIIETNNLIPANSVDEWLPPDWADDGRTFFLVFDSDDLTSVDGQNIQIEAWTETTFYLNRP